MKIKTLSALILAGGIALLSFDNGFKQTARGLLYQIKTTESTKVDRIKEGDYVKFQMIYKTDKDSILQSTYTLTQPLEVLVKIDTAADKGQVMEALTLLGKGDSATFRVPSHILFRGAPEGTPKPHFLDGDRFLCYDIKVLDVKSPLQMEAEERVATEKVKVEEEKAIADYEKANKLKLKSTTSGLRYQVINATTGAMPKSGDTVSVHYTGKLLDGKKFDSSYDRNDPINFQVGKQRVIAGWDEGLQLLKKGEKAVFVIPSKLAYGSRAMGDAIPANSVLVFDIELVDVKAMNK